MAGETNFKMRIRPKLEALPDSVWFKIQQVVIRDTPDFLGIVSGFGVGWELKADGDKAEVRKSQLYRLYRITKAGGWGRLVYPENFEEELQYLKDLPTLMAKRPKCPTIGEFYEVHGFNVTGSSIRKCSKRRSSRT